MADVVAKFRLDFFDAARVLAAVSRAERRVLSKFGAFVRTRARSSIRKRKASSPPGRPPSSHEGSLRRLLFFAYDSSSRSVVVGPVPFRRGEAPALLERGGPAVRRGKPARYRGNPFMAPAAEAERPRLAPLWRDSVR